MKVKQIKWNGLTGKAGGFIFMIQSLGIHSSILFVVTEDGERVVAKFTITSTDKEDAKKAAQDWLEKYVMDNFMEATNDRDPNFVGLEQTKELFALGYENAVVFGYWHRRRDNGQESPLDMKYILTSQDFDQWDKEPICEAILWQNAFDFTQVKTGHFTKEELQDYQSEWTEYLKNMIKDIHSYKP